jgi:hypothetical protein
MHTAAGLIARLRALGEVTQRRVATAEFLRSATPREALGVLSGVLARAAAGDVGARAAVEALVLTAGDRTLVGYEIRESLYAAAKEAGRDDIGRLFMTVSPATLSDRERGRQLASERPLQPNGRALTLGERKSAARTHQRDEIVRLIQDPHPQVVAVLLDNPHLTEPDVVRIAAHRPAVPESLERIADHPRWGPRRLVKRALVHNPYTPAVLAIRVATTLGRGDLGEVARDPQLPEELRRHARERLAGEPAR